MRNNSRNPFSYLVISTALLTGCYESGKKEDCIGFACPAGGQWPEGGQITMSHLFLPDGVSGLRQFHAFFIEDQSPDFPPIELPGSCNQLVEPGSQYEFREYIDAGPTVSIRGEGEEEFVLQRYTSADCGTDNPPPNGCSPDGLVYDFDFGPHEIVYLYATQAEPADGYFSSTFTVETADPIPYDNALSGAFMPPPVRQLMPTPGLVQIKKGEPLEVKWEPRTPHDPDIPIFGVLLFVDTTFQQWPWVCMVPNTGHYVVPAEITDQLTPTGGIMQVGYLTNQAAVTDDGRAINLFATECQASLWTLVQ